MGRHLTRPAVEPGDEPFGLHPRQGHSVHASLRPARGLIGSHAANFRSRSGSAASENKRNSRRSGAIATKTLTSDRTLFGIDVLLATRGSAASASETTKGYASRRNPLNSLPPRPGLEPGTSGSMREFRSTFADAVARVDRLRPSLAQCCSAPERPG
jgi:hypothetical protein